MKSFNGESVLLVINTCWLAFSLSSNFVSLHAQHALSWGRAMARRLIEARILGPGEDLSDESSSSSSSSDDEDEEALAKRRQAIIAKMQAAQTASERAQERSKPMTQLPSPNTASAQAKDLHSAPAPDNAPAIPVPNEKDTSSSDDDFAAPKLIFVSKGKRADRQVASFTEATTSSTSISAGRSHEQRVEESRTMVRDASLALQEAEADTATTDDMEMPDDTDGLDPTAEYEAWKLREQRRISLFAAVS